MPASHASMAPSCFSFGRGDSDVRLSSDHTSPNCSRETCDDNSGGTASSTRSSSNKRPLPTMRNTKEGVVSHLDKITAASGPQCCSKQCVRKLYLGTEEQYGYHGKLVEAVYWVWQQIYQGNQEHSRNELRHLLQHGLDEQTGRRSAYLFMHRGHLGHPDSGVPAGIKVSSLMKCRYLPLSCPSSVKVHG